mgnify:FL=1
MKVMNNTEVVVMEEKQQVEVAEQKCETKQHKVFKRHGMTAKATGQPSSQSNKSKGAKGTKFFFQASDFTPEYFMYVFQNGNRPQRRKAKKMLRRLGVEV